jgi:hypothetical protein
MIDNKPRIFATLLWASLILPAQDTTGIGGLRGTVVDNAAAPMPNVTVCILADRCIDTDAQGRYRFEQLRPATYTARIRVNGTLIDTASIEVHAGLETQADLTYPSTTRDSITVTEIVTTAPEELKTSAYLADGTQIFKSAGTFQDVSRFVQVFPGAVIGSDDFRNDLIVRGGSPLENLFIVDNVEVPNINTFANFASAGGTVSMLDPNLIRDVTFLTGGYPAPYGNRTSSVLQIAQREGNRERLRGRFNVLYGGVGGMLEGPLDKRTGGDHKGSWIVSARRSFLDLVTKDVGIGGVPVLTTYNGKASYDLSPRDRIWFVNLTGLDNIRLGLTEKNRDDPTIDANNFDIRYRGQRSATGLNWQHLFGTRGVGLLGLTHSQAGVVSTVRDIFRGGLPAPTTSVDDAIANSPIVFREDSSEAETTVKYDLTLETSRLGRVQTGGNTKFFRVRYNTASPFGGDSPYSLDRTLGAFSLDRSLNPTQNAAYVQTTKSLGRWNVTVGGRLDRYAYIERTRFSPRVGVTLRLTNQLAWSASYGHFYQQPFFLFVAAFDVNRNLTPFRAEHFVTGLRYTPKPGWKFGIEAYRKNYKDYPVARDLPQLSLSNLGDTFNVREILFPLTSAGRGRSEGIEISAEHTGGGKWFGQTNLSFFRTRQAGLDQVQRPSSFDYPRVFNAIGGYRLNRKWELGTRVVYLAGRPYTPFDVATSTAQQRGIFDLTRVNALRLPDYFRIDVRLDRAFTLRNRPALFFIGIQNVTNRKNIASTDWDRRASAAKFNDQLGLFPLLGFEWRF